MGIIVNKNIAVSETGFVFNPGTGESFTVNSTGARLLSLLREGLSDEEIISRMHNEFMAEKEDIERDLSDFKQSLKHYNLGTDNE